MLHSSQPPLLILHVQLQQTQHGGVNPPDQWIRCRPLPLQLLHHHRSRPNSLANSPRHLHLARVEHLLSARHHPPPTHRPGHIALRYSNRYTQSGPAKWYSGHLPRTHGSVVFARDGCPPYCDAVRTTGGESTSRADRVGSGFLGVRNVPADATDGRESARNCGSGSG